MLLIVEHHVVPDTRWQASQEARLITRALFRGSPVYMELSLRAASHSGRSDLAVAKDFKSDSLWKHVTGFYIKALLWSKRISQGAAIQTDFLLRQLVSVI